MANVLYPKAKEALLGADIDLEVDNIVAILIDTAAYTYSTTHTFLSEVPAGDRIATSSNLTSKTILNGVFDSADIVYTAVTGDPSEAIVLVQDSGSDTTSRLIAYIDTDSGGAISVTPNGTNININVNVAGWFTL